MLQIFTMTMLFALVISLDSTCRCPHPAIALIDAKSYEVVVTYSQGMYTSGIYAGGQFASEVHFGTQLTAQ